MNVHIQSKVYEYFKVLTELPKTFAVDVLLVVSATSALFSTAYSIFLSHKWNMSKGCLEDVTLYSKFGNVVYT